MNPRFVAELVKFTCGNCGTTFAVSSDFIRARLMYGYYLICCPLGHTMPIKTSPTQLPDVIPQLMARIEELEGPNNSRKKKVTPLSTKASAEVPRPPTEVTASERSIAMDNLGWTDIPAQKEPAKTRAQYNDSAQHSYKGQRNKVRKPGTIQCPYCDGWFKKVRQHARDFHKDVYNPDTFMKGMR